MPDYSIVQAPREMAVSKSVTSDLLETAQRMLSAGCEFEAKILTSLAEEMLRAVSGYFPPSRS